MAIDFSQVEDALKPAKATPRVDYSPWAKKPNESLIAYYKRLATQREGGILGTKGLMDLPKTEEPETEEKQSTETVEKGTVVKSESSSGPTDAEKAREERYKGYEDKGYTRSEVDTQDSIDRLRGVKYSGQGLFYGIPALIAGMSDKYQISKKLKANGYSDAEIKQVLSDPDLLGATHMMGRIPSEQPTERYNYFESGKQDSLGEMIGSVVDGVFGTNLVSRKGTQDMLPLSPRPGNNPSAVGYRGMPLQSQGRAAQIQAAQQKQLPDMFKDYTFEGLLAGFDPYQISFNEEQKLALELEREQNALRLAEEQAAREAELAAAEERYQAMLNDSNLSYEEKLAAIQAKYDESLKTMTEEQAAMQKLLDESKIQSDAETAQGSGVAAGDITDGSWDTSGGGTNPDGSYDFNVGDFTSDTSVTQEYNDSSTNNMDTSSTVVQDSGGSGSLVTGDSSGMFTGGSSSTVSSDTSFTDSSSWETTTGGIDYSGNTGSNFDPNDFTSDYGGSTSTSTSTSSGGLSTDNGGLTKNSDGSYTVNSSTSTSSSSSSSSGSSKWLCSKMMHMGKWTRKEAMATWKWHAAQSEHWKRGYDLWGRVLAKEVLNNDFWASVMQEWTDNKVKGAKKTWKAMLGSVVLAPCWIAGFFNDKPVGEFQLATKEEVA